MKPLKNISADEATSGRITAEENKLFLIQKSNGFIFQTIIHVDRTVSKKEVRQIIKTL